MKSKIYSKELVLYFSGWVFANLYSIFILYQAQSDILEDKQEHLTDLKPGWIVSRLQDVSDIEWNSWKYFINISWYYLITQFIMSEFIRNYNANIVKYWYIISSIIFVITFMGLKQFIIIILQPTIYFLVISIGGKKSSIWIISIFLLLIYNSLKYKHFFWYFLNHEELHDEEVYLMFITVAWIEARCISFCIDYVDRKDKTDICDSVSGSIINMLSYILYLPLLYTGPLILYEDFERSLTLNKYIPLKMKIRRFSIDICIFLGYTLLLDFSFHYIYFYAMQSNMELIRKLPSVALCGGGLWMGAVFHMKYVISYGTGAAFARLDNIEPPPTPRCIARIHVYSQMWRYFDVGLYRFLIKYIYKPSLKILSSNVNIPILIKKQIASSATFIFIFLWHGTIWDIFIWSFLNYLGITIEHVSKAVSQHHMYEWFRKTVLKTEMMEARFIAVLCTPLLALSAISNFYLFAGWEVGNYFFYCFTHPTFWNSLFINLSLYCSCHVSKSLENVPSRTDTRKY